MRPEMARHIPDKIASRPRRRDASNLIGEISLAALRERRGATYRANKFPGIVVKMSQAQTFLATFEIDHRNHANAGRHLDSRAAYDLRGCLYGSAADA